MRLDDFMLFLFIHTPLGITVLCALAGLWEARNLMPYKPDFESRARYQARLALWVLFAAAVGFVSWYFFVSRAGHP